MPIEILMPALSPTMTEGTLANWLKKEGDAIKAGQVLAEIETDKATMEVEAVDEGTLGKILVAAGTENVAVNTPIALLLEKGEDAASLANYVPKGVSAPTAAASPTAATPAPMAMAPMAATSLSPLVIPAQAGISPSSSAGGIIKRLFVSPLARKIAEQRGAHLGSIQGTGPNGRIIKADVERALSMPQGQAVPVAAAPAAPAGPNAKELADALGMVYREEKVSVVRKVIAQRLTESKQTVPHFYLTVAIALDNLMAKRAEMNDAAKGAYKLSVNDFIVKACAAALKKVPAANAAWNGSSVLYYDMADISVAVATPNGLVTPIVKAAETKSLADISAEVKDLALRARDGKLKPQEFQGGTFTISNLGMFGINEFSAIINPPQACILAVGAGEPTPVVVDGVVKIANVMKVTLSVDHRVVDGAVGAEYLQALKGYLEAPETML